MKKLTKDVKFKDIINNLDKSFNEFLDILNKSDYVERKNLKNINGLYVFYENDEPLYVGRTNKNRMKERILEHSRRSSNKNSATFAFLIWKENNNNSQNTVNR